jgi:BirA family biotin operon repressor/biotin-[acetyl-CoA-carboxylase] ligase
MKTEILSMLSESETPVSGERLSSALGVSRVAVWKHIRQLQEVGYDISATPKGYRLVSEPDTPFPWVFGDRSKLLHYYPDVTSTMDKAMEFAQSGCPAFTIVVAERQHKGRGRLARSWQSAAGGLYFTMVLRPRIAPQLSPLLNLAAAVDLSAAIEDLYDIPCQLKWPNDVLVNGRKLAGILSVMSAESDRIEFVNLGIGVNVHNNTEAVQPPAVSISQLTKQHVSRSDILKKFWGRFERRLAEADLADVVAQWRQKAITLGRWVKVQTIHDYTEGRAVDLEETGALVLETAEGERKTVVYGDCFHQDEERHHSKEEK